VEKKPEITRMLNQSKKKKKIKIKLNS
ncbi:hypothetical protein AVEN_628-1, partial [Araneus ventricosus]